jgi:hypothetical protein
MKKQAPIPQRTKTPLGCTPFLLPKRIAEVPKEWVGIEGLYAALYSPEEGPGPVADALGLFFAAVRGDQAVIRGLLDSATTVIAILGAIAINNPDVLRPIARKLMVWPDVIGVKEGYREKNEWLLKHLEVGKECSMRGKWNPKSPATATALFMYMWLQTNQRALGLPRLTHDTKKQWFEAGWMALCDVTQHHPEEHAFLRQIGRHYEQHSKNTGAQERVTAATRESNIRAGIKKQLWQSFKNLTQHLPKFAD